MDEDEQPAQDPASQVGLALCKQQAWWVAEQGAELVVMGSRPPTEGRKLERDAAASLLGAGDGLSARRSRSCSHAGDVPSYRALPHPNQAGPAAGGGGVTLCLPRIPLLDHRWPTHPPPTATKQVPAEELRGEVEGILAGMAAAELRAITAKPILKQLGA